MTAFAHEAPDWREYRMDYKNPHQAVEPEPRETHVVGEALEALAGVGALPHTEYDNARFLAHRAAVAERFEIPWTAITPRMQRLLYALNAIRRPQVMIAAGVFCGNTFISNAGAAVGPGACYHARELLGVEIAPAEAERAERNVRAVDPTGVARIVAADARDVVGEHPGPIDVLYLDADGTDERGKGVYLDILEAADGKLADGALVLAHNSVNCAERLQHYLRYVRESGAMRASVNVVIDCEGLEVSVAAAP